MLHLIIIFKMGQENLNCKNNGKEKEHQVQTTHSNALHLVRALQAQNQPVQSQIKSKKSATTVFSEIQNKPSIRTSKGNSKPQQAAIPQHQNLLKVAYSQFEGSEKIGPRWYQRGGKCLADIIEGRYNSNMHFPQSQIVALIESLVYALAYLQKSAIKHHDFYPTNIYYSSGIFKLTNPLSIEASAYALTQQRKRFSFLSPELIADIVQDTPQDDIPPEIMFKSDIFAIGMVVLQFCTLQPSAECYDEENYQLVDQTIKERLVKVAQLYSPMIADCVAEMLVYNIDDRIPVQDLALVVFLNSPAQKVEKAVKQPIAQSNQKTVTGLPPLPMKPNSPTLQQQKNPQQNQPQHPPQHVLLHGQPKPSGTPINQNNVVVPTPNYTYSHIGPNNQSLLSPSSLQNKLRVIEQIHQKPEFQEESQGQLSSLPSNFGPGVGEVQENKNLQPQRVIGNGAYLNPNQHPHPQFLQPNMQYIQQPGQFPQSPQMMSPPMRQVVFPPNHQQQPQQPPQYMMQNMPPPNPIQNIPPNPMFNNFVPQQGQMIQPNRGYAPTLAENLPQNGIKSTQVQSKYEPMSHRYEQESRYTPQYQQLSSPYENPLSGLETKNFAYKNTPPSYSGKTMNVAQKDLDLLYKPSYKESLQLKSDYSYQSNKVPNYKSNSSNQTYQNSYRGASHSNNKYSTQAEYPGTNGYGRYEPPSSANKYDSASIANKYAKPRDENGQTLQERVDRILQISRGIK